MERYFLQLETTRGWRTIYEFPTEAEAVASMEYHTAYMGWPCKVVTIHARTALPPVPAAFRIAFE